MSLSTSHLPLLPIPGPPGALSAEEALEHLSCPGAGRGRGGGVGLGTYLFLPYFQNSPPTCIPQF